MNTGVKEDQLKEEALEWETIIAKARKHNTEAYEKLIHSKNFDKKLEKAVGENRCLICQGDRVFSELGLCFECAQFVDRKLTDDVERDYKVSVVTEVTVART